MLSLKPMITFGLPGNVAPYTFTFGLFSCISYQMEGNVNSRCGSLHKYRCAAFCFFSCYRPVITSIIGILGLIIFLLLMSYPFFQNKVNRHLQVLQVLMPGASYLVPLG